MRQGNESIWMSLSFGKEGCDLIIRWATKRYFLFRRRKQIEAGQTTAIVDGSPEWYIKKFMDRTITAKQAGALTISLRSKEIEWGQILSSVLGVVINTIVVGSSNSLNCRVRLCWRRRWCTLAARLYNGKATRFDFSLCSHFFLCRRKEDLDIEYEVAKAIKFILNRPVRITVFYRHL